MVRRFRLKEDVDRMKPFTSFQELDALGEGLSKDYIASNRASGAGANLD